MTRTENELLDQLYAGDARIGVWGNGFIGYSTLANFANAGVEGVGYDIDAEIVSTINDGHVPIETLKYWLGFDVRPLVEEGLMYSTTDRSEATADDVRAHFICVPTEKDGEPWADPLRDVISSITDSATGDRDEPTLIIIESTLTPGMTEDIVIPSIEESQMVAGEDLLLGVAPRRDWFTSRDKSLADIPRVFGGHDQRASDYVRSVLSVVCDELVEASDHAHAEMVKSVENAYRHMGISLANQLARAYPEKDVREVLELAATKWNIPAYFPSVGTGGYCIPLSSKYVLSGATNQEALTLLSDAIRTDDTQPRVIADAIAEKGIESVTILGLAYKGDIKVDVLSPTFAVVDRLQDHGIDVSVNDPYFDDDYIAERTGAKSVPFPHGMNGSDAVLITAGHRLYTYTPDNEILANLKGCELVIDSPRIWDGVPFDEDGIEYTYTGGKGWITSPAEAESPRTH